MNNRKYTYLLILISLVIVATLSIQLYWNYKNYKESERQLIADVQTSINQSVDDYFTNRARENTMGLFFNGDYKDGGLDSIFNRIEQANDKYGDNRPLMRGLNVDDIKSVKVIKGGTMDTLDKLEKLFKNTQKNDTVRFPKRRFSTSKNDSSYFQISSRFDQDTLFREKVSTMTSKLVISMTDDTIDIEEIDSIFKANLAGKKINLIYDLMEVKGKAVDSTLFRKYSNYVPVQSSLLKKNQQLFVYYRNLTTEILKRNITGILLSFILIASVMFCLFYLLVIINRQKALGEMKNDLISNITHEFKTPIATASAALEGVQNFTASGDTEKTQRYLSMGREQLEKLNFMVEKLLETATLDSKDLDLQYSSIDLNELLKTVTNRFNNQTEKEVTYTCSSNDSQFMGDAFHLENALNNLIDNAIKYGGDRITILFANTDKYYIVTVSDNGKSLNYKDSKRVFDKFYRAGSGNTHNVKGFGIGLFYTKAIIEKHNGSIALQTIPHTSFNINLPYES
jgi:two-component system phosphate regulon sensor histidine kinase PhoR